MVRTTGTCCSNTWDMLSEHQSPRAAQRANARLTTAPTIRLGVRITCSGCSDKMFWVFGQRVPDAQTTYIDIIVIYIYILFFDIIKLYKTYIHIYIYKYIIISITYISYHYYHYYLYTHIYIYIYFEHLEHVVRTTGTC